MSDPAAFVHIDLAGETRFVGRLWARTKRERQSASFEYDQEWIAEPMHFALGPALPPSLGPHQTREGRTMFGALGDSAPDRWGRRLIARNEARRARELGETPRTPREIDYLLGVSDLTRQGALRFAKTADGPFLAEDITNQSVPPLIDLGALLSASRILDEDPDSNEADHALQVLLMPGSSLGGARPKASVLDNGGELAIAKFPKKSDDVDAVRWEYVMMMLAGRAGIEVSKSRIEVVGDDTPVLLTRRFDRVGTVRIPFLSAMSLLDAGDNEPRSYVEIMNAVREVGSRVSRDGAELWRRLAFNILASNFDDHLRNHAVIYDERGWRLSPAYDLNPVPQPERDRLLSTAINPDGDTTASIDLAIDAAEEFFISKDEARKIGGQVGLAVASWRAIAKESGLAERDIDAMAPAFEHRDAIACRRFV